MVKKQPTQPPSRHSCIEVMYDVVVPESADVLGLVSTIMSQPMSVAVGPKLVEFYLLKEPCPQSEGVCVCVRVRLCVCQKYVMIKKPWAVVYIMILMLYPLDEISQCPNTDEYSYVDYSAVCEDCVEDGDCGMKHKCCEGCCFRGECSLSLSFYPLLADEALEVITSLS